MNIRKFNVYTADLNPRFGTEPGKVRPVVVVQTDLLNGQLASTAVCPITTNVIPETKWLRIHLRMGEAGLKRDSDILVDQVRAVDNRRFTSRLGEIESSHKAELLSSLRMLILE